LAFKRKRHYHWKANDQGKLVTKLMSDRPLNSNLDILRHGRYSLTVRKCFFHGCFFWFVAWQISLAGDPPPPSKDAWSNPQNPVVKLWEGNRLDLWSLKSPTQPSVPSIHKDIWSRNSIDVFIRSKQISLGLVPTREADKLSLIRRATLDLVGLPPTTEEIQAFLSDDAPNAYDKLIERLLASHDFGIRWA